MPDKYHHKHPSYMIRIFSPQWTAIATAVLLICICIVLPHVLKSWFVSDSGQISIAPGPSLLIVAGILLRWSWSRKLGILLAGIIFAGTLFQLTFFAEGYAKGPLLLLLLTGLLLALLLSKDMKAYFERKGASEQQ